ncbi:hypothetical protein J5TS2_44370 [Brevibacillus halotolerans]|uniref:MFS transporter n=1 Tax=Brevibacillus halotolerans TaxID=1507437 RepID=UPI001B2623FD|nr:MFS transporter [Brevibacillus halotolerans]GIO03769.1 hypothetical protein J5TS2_44370 [Brevibacillus halotolerans]
MILRAIAGFFFGGIPAKAQAYVMGWTTQETRTWGMALFGAANGLGFVLGPAMSGGLAVISLTVPMYAVALLILIIAVIFLLTIPDEQESEIRRTTATISPNDSRIRLYLWIGFYIQDTLGYNAQKATQLIGLGLAISGIMVVASQVLISKYLKWKPAKVLRVGLSCVTLGLVGFLLFIRFAYIDFAILGIGIGFTLLGYSSGASLAVEDHEQRSVASFIAALQGGGSFFGPVIGTLLYTSNKVLPFSFCVLLICLSGISLFRKRHRVRVSV